MLGPMLQQDEPMFADWLLAALSDPQRLLLLHVGGGASAAGLLKQLCRRLQKYSVLQDTVATSARTCTTVRGGIL